MAQEEFSRAFTATTPEDTNDPPRFSQGSETVKDVLVLELRRFFAAQLQSSGRLAELPTIEKYQTFGNGLDPYETVLQILRKHPGVGEALPHVVVTTADGRMLPLSIGTPVIAQVQDSPRITTAVEGPYDLSFPNGADGQTLVLRTQPKSAGRPVESRLVFLSGRFSDLTAATAAEVCAAINEQALYVEAQVVPVGAGEGVEIRTGGPYGRGTPNEIEVLSSSTPELVLTLGLATTGSGGVISGTAPTFTFTDLGASFTASDVGRNLVLGVGSRGVEAGGPVTAVLSSTSLTFTNKYGVAGASPGAWFIGARDTAQNALRPPKNRYVYAWDLDVNIDVIAEDENTRTELVDLVGGFLSFWLESRYFTFLGRGAEEDEYFMLVLKSDVRSRGESETPRPEDGNDKLYVNGFSVNVHATMYLDREVLVPSGPSAGLPWMLVPEDLELDEGLPTPS